MHFVTGTRLIMKIVLLLALLTVSECDSRTVVGETGQNVTLSCKYDIRNEGSRSVCWGRGNIPVSSCNHQLISTDGHKVIERTRVSSRYQLLGRLDEGDVSLTILNLTETDAGRYGCRVDIYGWFNDAKHHFDLTIERDTQTTTSTTLHTETSTEQTTASYTAGQVTSAESLPTSSSDSINAKQESGGVTVLLVCILFGVVALITAGGLFIIVRKWRRLNKIPQQQQQQVNSSVQVSSTASTLQLCNRGSAVENIYQIDEGSDVVQYEYCP